MRAGLTILTTRRIGSLQVVTATYVFLAIRPFAALWRGAALAPH
jgi:hypothetical protein